MVKLEHIGIAISDLEGANLCYKELLGGEPYKQEEVESEGVITSFFRVGSSKIELLKATREDSPIAKFIARHGEGLHHLAFEVENIYHEIQRLKNQGFRVLNEEPKKGADNKLVCFIHPKSTGGVLVELCQEIPRDY